jgi:hypothetical protein
MTARLKFTESTQQIQAKILFEFAEVVDKRMRGYAPLISREVGELIAAELRKTPHVISLLSGKLQADFGLTPAAAQTGVDEIISKVRKSTVVRLSKNPKTNLVYTISIQLLPEGISSLLDISYASYRGRVTWVEWLLTKGVTIVVEDFWAMSGEFEESRSGRAIMVPVGNDKVGFRVDPEFAGTPGDNFVVNTIQGLLPAITNVIRKYLL